MRSRVFLGLTFSVFMVGACGGSAELGDDFPGGDDDAGVFSTDDGGVSTGIVDGGIVITDASFGGDGGFGRDGGFIGDGGFGGDGGRHHRDGGIGEFDGGISVPDSGIITPPPPPEDGGGPVGPHDAGAFGGPVLRDANGVVLGEIVSIQSEGAVFTIVTGNDFVIDISFDGTFPDQAFTYSGLNCTGSIALSSGPSTRELLDNTAYYSTTLASFLIPAGPFTSGAEASIPITQNSTSDPCVNGGASGGYGWPLVETTAANIGLPATIAAPLSYP